MPPRKKKVVEEEKPIVDGFAETGILDEVSVCVDDVVKEISTVEETDPVEDTDPVEETDPTKETTPTKETSLVEETNKAIEIVKEELTIVSEVMTKPLSDLFLDFIKKSNDSKIVLSKESIDILNKIFSLTPNFLDDIEKSLLEVVKDGKIDSNDIPHLILLIQKLYETIYKIKEIKLDSKTRTSVCSEALKNIAYFLITERRIKIEEERVTLFLEQINTLIDSCVGLLSFSNNIKVKGCFNLLFGKK